MDVRDRSTYTSNLESLGIEAPSRPRPDGSSSTPGTGMATAQGLKPVFALHAGGATYPLYIGLIALALNIVVAFVVSMVTPRRAHVHQAV